MQIKQNKPIAFLRVDNLPFGARPEGPRGTPGATGRRVRGRKMAAWGERSDGPARRQWPRAAIRSPARTGSGRRFSRGGTGQS